MYQVGYTKLYFRTGQIGALEDTRKRVLQSVTSLQKCFRGYKARTLFVELKSKISSLQSLIRGENARRKYESLLQKHRANLQKNKHKHKRSASKALDDQQKAIVQLQSVVRGWLARKHYDDRQTLQDSNVKTVNGFKAKDSKIRQVKDVSPADVPISNNVVEELQRWVARAETTLVPKEEENKSLRTQLQQYETRWSKYEAKMRSMEDMWQKQIASLQVKELVQAQYCLLPMGITSENVAQRFGVTREEQDQAAVSYMTFQMWNCGFMLRG